MNNIEDPRSCNYARVYNKEPINKKRLFIIILINLILNIISYLIFKKISMLIFVSTIYLLLCMKYILILLVKIYQKIAPISIRSKCRFEPSCSNYMLQCLEKYGLFKGLKKGINRLKRCNINDGGYDYP